MKIKAYREDLSKKSTLIFSPIGSGKTQPSEVNKFYDTKGMIDLHKKFRDLRKEKKKSSISKEIF